MTDDLTHSPNCTRPGTTTTHGHSVDIVKCTGCGALSTTRHGATITTRKD
jgi:ribosomal protein S27E